MKNRLIVVLGMHRSGTSAITKSLGLMDVGLGSNLHPAGFDNPKGFWEDKDCLKINIELLEILGSDYDRLNVDLSKLESDSNISELKSRAVKLISDRFQENNGLWGFKDPRTCRLLQFWDKVFSELNCEVSYIFVVRNPASVAASLLTRNNIQFEKSYLLWLEHVLPSIKFSMDSRTVVVDYDDFLARPYDQLLRISTTLKLHLPEKHDSKIVEFENNFLETSFRHTHFNEHDLKRDQRAPALLYDTYKLLKNIASDKLLLNSIDVKKQIITFNNDLLNVFALSGIINSLEDQLKVLSKSHNEFIQSKSLELQSREKQVHELNLEVQSRDKQVHELNLEVQSRDKQVHELNLELQSRDKQVHELNLEVNNKDYQIEEFSKLVELLQSENNTKKNQLLEKDNLITDLMNSIENINQSTSWVVTKPLRILSGFFKKRSDNISESFDKVIETNTVISSEVSNSDAVDSSTLTQELPTLPEDFNAEVYLKLNPDVAAVDIDPVIHYLHYGIGEGRSYSISPIEYNVSKKINPNFATILVVSHEASITGAPVLSLNLVKSFSKQYNVVSLLLGAGDLCEEFKLASNAFKIQPNLRIKPEVSDLIIDQLCKAFNFKFAVINSIESRDVLPSLNNRFVPTITLIHEFASYTRPKDAFEFTFNWSNEVVFSTEITLNNARSQCQLEEYKPLVLPQGRCLLPSNRYTEFEIQAEKNRLIDLLKPSSLSSDTILILGAGSVQLRKGVDLFIDCANRVVNVYNKTNCRFVWIGKGFDPVNDAFYSVYLADQIHRCGLDNFITFIDETYAIEAAYETADLFLMTSRLDPLPNVAIDAMTFGLPVLCFENTTGIANFFKDVELDKQCVLPYLDTEKMANAIFNLVNNPDAIKLLGDQSKLEAIKYFDMNSYVTELDGIANNAIKKCNQLKDDINLIAESKLLRPDFYDPNYLREGMETDSSEKNAKSYIRDWAKTKKPFPGFHPEIYKTEHGLNNTYINPFADYLRTGQPEGSWKNKVIDNSEISMFSTKHYKVALHIHVFYPDLLKKIISALKLNQSLPDIYISFTDVVLLDELNEVLNSYDGKVIDIKPVPNLGRDIGPLLTLFGEAIAENYDYFGHIHTKKTRSLTDEHVGQVWFDFLLENLIGGKSSGSMMDKVLNTFFQDETIGMIFPDDPHIDPKVMSWNENLQFAENLKLKLGIDELPLNFNFPVGTMFWANTSLLLPFLNLNLDWTDYPKEPLAYNGTMLHALERLFPLALSKQYKVVTTNVFGITR